MQKSYTHLPISLGKVLPTRLRLLSEPTCVGSRYGHERSDESPFHGIQELAELCIHRATPIFTDFSSLQDSIGFDSWLASTHPELSETQLALPRVLSWFRNINLIPFQLLRLRAALGSTNCRLTNIAGKPYGFRRSRFQLDYAATHGRIFNSTRSTPALAEASIHAERSPYSCSRNLWYRWLT